MNTSEYFDAAAELAEQDPRTLALCHSIRFMDFNNVISQKGQLKFIIDLAISGLISCDSLINGLSSTHYNRVNKIRFIRALSDSVILGIRNKYRSLYSHFTDHFDSERLKEACGVVLPSTWDLRITDDRDDRAMELPQTKGAGILLLENSSFTELDFSLFTRSGSLWMTAYIDQLSLAGIGFMTLGSILLSSSFFLEDLQPNRGATLNLKKIAPLIDFIDETTDFDFDTPHDTNPHFETLYQMLENCLDFDGNLSEKDIAQIKFDYYNQIELFDGFTNKDEISGFASLTLNFITTCDDYGYDPTAILAGRLESELYGNIESGCIGGVLKSLVDIMPDPGNAIEHEIFSFIKTCTAKISSFYRIFIEADELSPMDARIIHGATNRSGEEYALNSICDYEQNTVMQIESFGWTQAVSPDQLTDLLEGEAYANAVLTGMYLMLERHSDKQRSSHLSVLDNRSLGYVF